MERKPLRNTLFILFFILILLLGAYFYMNMQQHKISSRNDSVMVQSPGRVTKEDKEQTEQPEAMAEEEEIKPEPPAAKPAPPVKPSAPERFVTGHHTVEEGESFSLVTGYYWDDIFLWPDLYIRNDMRSVDPDLIFPKEIIDIYNRLGNGDIYSDIETEEILKSYLKVYRIYKELGDVKNNSVLEPSLVCRPNMTMISWINTPQ